LTFSGERDNICLIPPATIIARSEKKGECEDVKGVPKVPPKCDPKYALVIDIYGRE